MVKPHHMGEFKDLIYEIRNNVGWVTLNRPEKRNALNQEIVNQLKSALADAETDDQVRVIVLRGAGKDFCAGADLANLEKLSQATILDNIEDASRFAALLLQIRKLKKPVIAAVHGRALAGGAGLSTACDLVVAARSASFSYTEVKIGFVPAIVMAIARRNMSEKRAFEILCTGKTLTAEEAERIGLINLVFDDQQFESELEKLASGIAQISSSAIALTKSLLYQTDTLSFDQAMRSGVEMNAIARMTPDCREGIRKFLSRE
jgi:methylglutaconyl-CoA hydratase